MPIDFPIDPGLTPSYQYTYNGITQNWNWGFSGGSGVSAWLATGFTITSGGQAVSSIYDLTNVTGQNYNFAANNTSFLKYNLSESIWQPSRISFSPDILGVTIAGPQQNQVLTYFGGQWTNKDIPSVIFGQITGGGAGMTKAPKLAIVAGDSSVTITGITSDAGITISITAGAGGGANPEGPEGSVQFADGSSLSGVAEARIVTVNNINNQRGFSGNFVYYTESTTGNSAVISDNTTISVPFGTRNIYVVDNIALGANETLTFGGFTGSRTGASMTLVLGYTGESTSTIVFPGNQGIYWAEGPFGVTTGSDAKIYPRTSPKKFDILYFFADGTRIYGNAQKDFKTSR
jgi:hypothetical protein